MKGKAEIEITEKVLLLRKQTLYTWLYPLSLYKADNTVLILYARNLSPKESGITPKKTQPPTGLEPCTPHPLPQDEALLLQELRVSGTSNVTELTTSRGEQKLRPPLVQPPGRRWHNWDSKESVWPRPQRQKQRQWERQKRKKASTSPSTTQVLFIYPFQ